MSKLDALAEAEVRHDWERQEVRALFDLPFNDLLYTAHRVHRRHFEPNTVQVSTLLSIKTGTCPEDCAYCPQSVRFNTGLESERLMEVERVVDSARKARERGATRFCMGAAWRSPKNRDLDTVVEMVQRVRELGMETCLTAGMLTDEQARRLADNGLDYYNHNIDTSEEFYSEIITTRTFQDRLETLEHIREAGMKVCCGGIIGMGETVEDRAEMLRTLANLPEHPQSVPINQLIQVPGTPLHGRDPVEPFEFVRVIAVARILMPGSHVRLAAGRTEMSEEMQAMCFFAGVNSIFYGEKLLTTPNPDEQGDHHLFERLGLKPEAVEAGEERRQATAGAASQA